MMIVAELADKLRAIAHFYETSPNMSTDVVNVHGPDGSFTLSTYEMRLIADIMERTP